MINHIAESTKPTNSLFRQILSYGGGAIIPALIMLLSSAVFTRLLTPSDYGRYSVVLAILGVTTALSSRWLEQGVGRYLPGAALGTPESTLLKAGIVSSLTVVMAVTLVLAAIAPGAARMFGQNWMGPLYWSAIPLLLVSGVSQPIMVVFQAEMRAWRYSYYQILTNAVKFISSLALVLWVNKDSSSLVWGTFIGLAVSVPLMWKDAGLPVAFRWKLTRSVVLNLATYGVPMVGWFLAATLLNVGDRWVIQLFRGSSEVGVYSANYGLISGAVTLVSSPIMLAAHPFLMRAWGAGERARAAHWMSVIVGWYLVGSVALVGATVLFSADIARLFLGESFRTGHVIMAPVVAGVLVGQLGLYAHKPLEFFGETRLMLRLFTVAATLNMLLNVALVPRFGYIAAGYTTLISYAFYCITAGSVGQKRLRWTISWRPVLENSLLCLLGLVASWFVRSVVQVSLGPTVGLFVAALLAGPTLVIVVLRQYASLRRERPQ